MVAGASHCWHKQQQYVVLWEHGWGQATGHAASRNKAQSGNESISRGQVGSAGKLGDTVAQQGTHQPSGSHMHPMVCPGLAQQEATRPFASPQLPPVQVTTALGQLLCPLHVRTPSVPSRPLWGCCQGSAPCPEAPLLQQELGEQRISKGSAVSPWQDHVVTWPQYSTEAGACPTGVCGPSVTPRASSPSAITWVPALLAAPCIPGEGQEDIRFHLAWGHTEPGCQAERGGEAEPRVREKVQGRKHVCARGVSIHPLSTRDAGWCCPHVPAGLVWPGAGQSSECTALHVGGRGFRSHPKRRHTLLPMCPAVPLPSVPVV